MNYRHQSDFSTLRCLLTCGMCYLSTHSTHCLLVTLDATLDVTLDALPELNIALFLAMIFIMRQTFFSITTELCAFHIDLSGKKFVFCF